MSTKSNLRKLDLLIQQFVDLQKDFPESDNLLEIKSKLETDRAQLVDRIGKSK